MGNKTQLQLSHSSLNTNSKSVNNKKVIHTSIMDMMMRDLILAHNNASKLEVAIRKERVNLINAFKNRESSDSDWYIVKTKYVGLSAELTKETDKISAILQELEQTDATSAISIEEYADIAENTNDFASSSDDLEINSLYNESLPINDEQFIQRSASRVSVKVEPEPEPQPIVKPEPQMSKATQFVTMSQDIQIVSAPAPKVQSKPIQSVRPKSVQRKSKPKATPIRKRRTVISVKHNTGYKYCGKGFEVFTGYKNNSKPIYTSTTLFCRETMFKNKRLLKDYLCKEGKFTSAMIENISFGHNDVAYIRVRASMKTIRQRVRQLNNKCGNVLSVYERKQYWNDVSAQNNVLYVNNFDITDKQSHKRFTNLFLKYGQLIKDVKMGIDRNADPFAIVHFVHLEDARLCFESNNVRFGDKKLSVNYSKRM